VNIQTKNNKRFQRDEFIMGKASVNLKSLETSKPKTTSDVNATNYPNQKQQAISTRSIYRGESKRQSLETSKPKTTSEFNARQSSPRLKLE
jgi:hypothetical protein